MGFSSNGVNFEALPCNNHWDFLCFHLPFLGGDVFSFNFVWGSIQFFLRSFLIVCNWAGAFHTDIRNNQPPLKI